MRDKIEIKVDKKKLLDKVTSNLNLSDISVGSYLHTLVDGLSDVNDKVVEDINKTVDNLYIETANEETLESYGLLKGLPRLKSKIAFSRSTGAQISLQPEFFVYTKDLVIKLFSKGEKLEIDIMRITFLEDVYYNSNLSKVYISCEISIGSNRALSTSFLKEGQKFVIPVPTNHKTLLSSLVLNVETPMGFTDYEEDLETYRSKLKALASSENISSSDVIEKIISSSRNVYKYFIDKSTYPITVYYMSPLLYYSDDLDALISNAEHYLKVHTDAVRGYTTNFEFKLPEKVEFKMNIITADHEKLRAVLADFMPSFVTYHSIGYDFVIDKEYVKSFLNRVYPEFDQQFEVEFYYTNGIVNVLTETRNSLTIKPNAYPKLHSITINGDYNDVEPYI